MKTIRIAFLSILLCACKPGNVQPPDLIDKKVMGQILLDVNLAESYSAMVKDSLHKAGSKNTDSLSLFYKDIFAHYKVTPAQFSASLSWYKGHPDLLDTMYNNMSPAVTRWQAGVKPATPPPPPPSPANIPVK